MRYLTVLLMLLISAPAAAEWVKFAKARDGATYYYNPATVQVVRDLSRVLVLVDVKEGNAEFQMPHSYSILEEYDCKERRWRKMSVTLYNRPMADGRSAEVESTPSEWLDIAPKTVEGALLKIVCAVR